MTGVSCPALAPLAVEFPLQANIVDPESSRPRLAATMPLADPSSCAAKLRRAEQLFAELDLLARAFIEGARPYRAAVEVDPKTDEIVYRLTDDVLQPPSTEWGPLIGDIAHNQMSALDHLVCLLSVLNGSNPDCTTTEFPVFEADGRRTREQIKKEVGSLETDDQRLL